MSSSTSEAGATQPDVVETASALAPANKSSLREWLASVFELGEPTGGNRMQAMEGLRGLAILLVFFCHYYDIIYRKLELHPLLTKIGMGVMEAGGTGVALFFVLSGMLIYRAVLRPKLDLKKFFARRIERIYPTFIAIFVLYLVIDALLAMRPHAAPYDVRIPSDPISAATYLLANLAFLPGLFPIQPLMNVAWSLSYEWMFYVVLPIAALLLGLNAWAARYRIALCIVLAVILATATFAFPSYFFLGSNPIRDCHVSIIMFLGGMVISDLMAAGVNHRRQWTDALALILLVTGLLVPFLYGWNNFRMGGRGPALVRHEVLIMAALFLGYGVAVYYTLASGGWLNRLFSIAPLRWMGNMSYSFYLVHGLPMHIVAMAVARTHIATYSLAKQILFIAVLFPITFIVTAAISAVVFVLVEKPFSLKPKRSAAVSRA